MGCCSMVKASYQLGHRDVSSARRVRREEVAEAQRLKAYTEGKPVLAAP